MSDRNDDAGLAVSPIDQAVGEPCHPALPEVIIVGRPALGSFADARDRAAQGQPEPFLDRLTSLAVPASRLAALGDRLGMEVNDLSGHPKDRRSAFPPPPREPASPPPTVPHRDGVWPPSTRPLRHPDRRARVRRFRGALRLDPRARPPATRGPPGGAFQRAVPWVNLSPEARGLTQRFSPNLTLAGRLCTFTAPVASTQGQGLLAEEGGLARQVQRRRQRLHVAGRPLHRARRVVEVRVAVGRLDHPRVGAARSSPWACSRASTGRRDRPSRASGPRRRSRRRARGSGRACPARSPRSCSSSGRTSGRWRAGC